MTKKIESMNLEQIAELMTSVAKRVSALRGHNNDKEIHDIAISVFKMKPKKLNSILKIIELSDNKLDENALRYISKHAKDVSDGKAARVPRIEFPWSRSGLINFANACGSAETYVRNFSRLEAYEQERIGDITKLFIEVEAISKKISKLSEIKSLREKNKKLKTLKEEKAAIQEEAKVEDVEKELEETKVEPNVKTDDVETHEVVPTNESA